MCTTSTILLCVVSSCSLCHALFVLALYSFGLYDKLYVPLSPSPHGNAVTCVANCQLSQPEANNCLGGGSDV